MGKRKFDRTGFCAEAEITHKETSCKGTIEDLSLKGLFIRTSMAVPVNEAVAVSLGFRNESGKLSFTIPATVVRATATGVGLSFRRIDINSLLHEQVSGNELSGAEPSRIYVGRDVV